MELSMSASGRPTRNRPRMQSACWLAVWTLAMLLGRSAPALTPLNSIRYAPDITVVLGGTAVDHNQVAEDNLGGAVSLVDVGPIPASTSTPPTSCRTTATCCSPSTAPARWAE